MCVLIWVSSVVMLSADVQEMIHVLQSKLLHASHSPSWRKSASGQKRRSRSISTPASSSSASSSSPPLKFMCARVTFGLFHSWFDLCERAPLTFDLPLARSISSCQFSSKRDGNHLSWCSRSVCLVFKSRHIHWRCKTEDAKSCFLKIFIKMKWVCDSNKNKYVPRWQIWLMF